MPIPGISQKTQQQQIINASGQNQQPAVNGSVFNEQEATAVGKTGEELSCYSSGMSNEEMYNQFIEEMTYNFKDYGITREKVLYLFDQIGYTKEKCLSLSKNDFYETMMYLSGIIENTYGMDVDTEQRCKDVIALSKYNDIRELNEYLCDNASYSIKDIIHSLAENKKIELPDELREKWKNLKSLNDLSVDELSGIVMMLVRNETKLNISAEKLMSNLFLNLPKEVLEKNSILCDQLYSAFKQVNENEMPPGVYLLMIDKLKDSSDELKEFLTQEKIGDIFGSFNDATRIRTFFNNAQQIINSGKAEDKSVLANQVSVYLDAMLRDYDEINKKPNKSPKDIKFLQTYERLKELHAVATGYALTNADDKHVEELVSAPMLEDFRNLAFRYTHEMSLDSELNLDAVKIKERLDNFTQNAYSQILTEMGYEMPTADNLEALREQAKNGTLLPSEGNSESDGGIGYAQASQNTVSMAAEKAEVIASYITPAPAQETFTIEGKAEEPNEKIDIQPAKPVNVTNLGLFSGNELEQLINEKLIKFTDAVKQYSSKLSQSGKDFVVDKIKRKSKGEQAYALNKTSNNAKFDIMKKANLMDEDLNVKFDTVHEQLREQYMA